MSYDPKGTVFEFMFKDELSPVEVETVRDIARLPIIVHPEVLARIKQILDEHPK